MITSLRMWWNGYITVRFRGPGLERLLNKAALSGIELRCAERLTAEVILVRLDVRDFRHLRPLLRGTQINVCILDRHGLPFLLRKFKSRVFFACGLAACLIFMAYLSEYIWFIEVAGCETLTTSELKIAIEELGLRAGTARRAVVPGRIEKGLLMRFPVLAWAEVGLKGVKAQIRVAERNEAQEQVRGAGHIYARVDGMITELLVLRGTPQIEKGDTVQKGDLLISGVYYDAKGDRWFGAAEGIVRARVWYEAIGEAPLIAWEPLKTGRRSFQFLVTLGPWTIPIGRARPRETHLQERKEWCLSLGAALVPLGLARIEYQEVEYFPTSVPLERAKEAALSLARESLLKRGVNLGQILVERKELYFMDDQDGVRIALSVEVEEEIGLFLNQ